MADDDVVVAKKKRTLLEKYDIPVTHLSYEYVKKCNDGKELERIVKILRSGEEGLYPDLVKCAETRLAEIMPDSRVLRVEEPILTKSMMTPEHWSQVDSDLTEWSNEMKTREQDLAKGGDSLISVDVPGIRSNKNTKEVKRDNQEKEVTENRKTIVPRDYSEWEKYDADKEMLRMDLEEEKKKEELERKQRTNEREAVKKSSSSRAKIVGGAGDYSNAEKQFLATQEKDKGNEYFKSKEYKQAIEHYTASIAIDPTPVAYNNRAMAHLKLEQYLEALRDSNKVLQVEPNNVKALHRRGVAHKHRGNFQKAFNDFIQILQLEPSNRVANTLAKEMQTKLDSAYKSVRMQISEIGDDDGPKIVELPDEADYFPEPCIQDPTATINTSWPQPPDRRVKCNEFGLPKVMCNCSGTPDWVCRPPPRCLVCKEIKERRRREEEERQQATGGGGACTSESDSDGECEHVSATQEEAEGQKGGGEEEASVSREAGLPKVKSGCKTEAWPVPVASKDSALPLDTGEEEAAPGLNKVQAIRGLSLQDSGSKISTPFEFMSAMQSVQKGADAVHFAPILRRVDPSDLKTIISNNLEDRLLSTVLECLEKCFLDDCAFVLNFLENLSKLPRFNIAMMFMESQMMQVVGRIFDHLEQQNHPPSDSLRKAYLQTGH